MDNFFTNDEALLLNLDAFDNIDMDAHQLPSEEDDTRATIRKEDSDVPPSSCLFHAAHAGSNLGPASADHELPSSGYPDLILDPTWADYGQTAPSISMQASLAVNASVAPFYGTTFNLPSASVAPGAEATFSDLGWENIPECAGVESSTQSLFSTNLTPPALPPSNVKSNDSGLRCSRPECRHKTFKRKYEYERHLRTHLSAPRLRCPISYCRRHRQPFNREDKLCEHIRRVHSQDELGTCPIDRCSTADIPLTLLRWHCQFHKNGDGWEKILSQSLNCCLKKCTASFWREDVQSYQNHLLSHDMKSRRQQQDAIRRIGFEFDSANIICPICQSSFEMLSGFVTHLESAHLTIDYEHWRAFVDFCKSMGIEIGYGGKEIWSTPLVEGNPACPHCKLPSMSQPFISQPFISPAGIVDHHIQLLNMSDEIRINRAAILRLIPDFIHHPVFDEDLPQVSRSEYWLGQRLSGMQLQILY